MKSSIRKSKSNGSTRRPPARLSWPSTLKDSSKGFKRPREAQDSELWVDKFTPFNSSDLCVAPKKVKECRAWLDGAIKSPNQHKLLVLVGAPGGGKSTMVKVLAREMGMNIHSWNESLVPREPGIALDQLMSVEHSTALDSFEEFLCQCGAGFSSLQLTNDSSSLHSSSTKRHSVVLLEELPNLHGTDMALRFRNIMSQHLMSSHVPTILVFSDVSEGSHKPSDLERLIDPKDLYSPCSLICQIHSVTKAKMKKILESIAQQQRFLLSSSVLDELHLQSVGDLRHAIMSLQVQFCGNKRSAIVSGAVKHNDRDQALSTFHALGKLLYAKRKCNEEGVESLAFDPEAIIAQSDLGVRGSLRFLEYHSPEFFMDIDDIGEVYTLFSDASFLLENFAEASFETNTLSTNLCASSIAGRAVANCNKHPAPARFRQFSTPKVFDVLRKRRQNETLLSELAQRLSNHRLAPSTAIRGSNAFVTEILPAMRIISPDLVDSSVENFYSIARDSMENMAKQSSQSKDKETLEIQTEILGEDDIEDFDSDGEPSMNHRGNQIDKHEAPAATVASEILSLSQKENYPSYGDYQRNTVNVEVSVKASPEVIVIDSE